MPRRGHRKRIAKGISRDETGFSVRFQIAGEPVEKRFPLDTTVDLKKWRDDEIKKRKDRIKAGLLPVGSFAADAAKYLDTVTALPEYDQRVRDIGLWVEIFGDRRRDEIEPWEIRLVRDRWLTVGPKLVQRKEQGQKARYVAIAAPLAPNTVALRMRALENLWSVLDGIRKENPVREVPEPQDRDPEPRGFPYNIVEFILGMMAPSKSRARLRVMAYTGLAQVEIKGINKERGDLNLQEKTVWIRRRRKGRGGKMAAPAKQPLNEFGVRAFREFVKADAFGPFSDSALWKRFKAAVRRAHEQQPSLGLLGMKLKPYDLRHCYGTAHYAAGRDLKATQESLRQRNQTTTVRYASAAVAPAMLKASQLLEALIRKQQRKPKRARSSAQFRLRKGAVRRGAPRHRSGHRSRNP